MSLLRKLTKSRAVVGKTGEFKTNLALSRLPQEYIVRSDILIPNERGGTSQIDHVVLSPYGIFVVESKNVHGTTKFGHNDRFLEVQQGTRTSILYNPIWQNQGHIRALHHVLGDLSPTVYVNLVAFAKGARVHADTETWVGYVDAVASEILRYRNRRFTDDQVQQLDAWLREAHMSVCGQRGEHVKQVKRWKR